MKKIIALALGSLLLLVAIGAAVYVSFQSSLPQIISVADYKPLLVSEVYARGGEKIGEYSRQIRTLVPIEKVPKQLIQAFLAIEDRQFYEHEGINYLANLRALFTNLTSGKTVGASTITQQLARQLFLSPEKTYTRKLREVMLAKRLEENLTKDEILYLYLNQIYFGSGAHGIVAAADVYFRKTLDKLTVGEMAIIAGLPQRPSAYSPIENPRLAKGRQREVLNAMAAIGAITKEEADTYFNEPVTVYLTKEYKTAAAFAVETIRQMLVAKIGEGKVLDEGVRVYTTIDFKQQQAAQEYVKAGLRDLDKRQGFRGSRKKIENAEDQNKFYLAVREQMIEDKAPIRVITPEGMIKGSARPLEIFHKKDAKGVIVGNLPDYAPVGKIVQGIVVRVDDDLGLVYVRFAEVEALLDIADMDWARKPDATVNAERIQKLSKPSAALKAGDVIEVKILADRFASSREKELTAKIATLKKTKPALIVPDFGSFAKVALEQEPVVQGSLISFDLKSGETVALVGGYEFVKNVNEFNRALQAKRQTGSSFKSIVYAAALDKGFTPATAVQDAPIVYEGSDASNVEGQETDIKKWKPHNHGEKFAGDTLFRTALVRSLNIPTVKILEQVSVGWVIDYARRLGIFSPLNNDLSLGLGSSSITLYEMTRAFAEFGRLGKRLRPLIVNKVLDREGNVLLTDLSLDTFFEKELAPVEKEYEEKRLAYLQTMGGAEKAAPVATPAQAEGATEESAGGSSASAGDDPSKRKTPLIYFSDADQLMTPQTAYVMTSLLAATVTDPMGTAAAARSLGRPVAGKTGTTNGYFDGWFVGFTPQLATGVWVGFDEERSLGAGEVGGRTALPIWNEYMKMAHGDQPAQNFPVPSGIVFANIDSQTGKLASSSSKTVVNQAFIRGTEPHEMTGAPATRDDTDFYKEDLNE